MSEDASPEITPAERLAVAEKLARFTRQPAVIDPDQMVARSFQDLRAGVITNEKAAARITRAFFAEEGYAKSKLTSSITCPHCYANVIDPSQSRSLLGKLRLFIFRSCRCFKCGAQFTPTRLPRRN